MFSVAESILECTFGLMIGTELIWKQMKSAGSQILITTITESLGTFVVVSLVFGVIFWFTGTPLYLAFLFGGIALATAPAPSLSVVRDLKTSGPVTRTLIPMAALDDLVGALVFFLVIAFVSAHLSTPASQFPWCLFLVFLPAIIGAVTGYITGKMLRRTKNPTSTLTVMLAMLLASAGIGFNITVCFPPRCSTYVDRMSFSTVFANMITEEQLKGIMEVMNPVIGFAMIVVILNLGAPLDYHLIFGAGIYTAVYNTGTCRRQIQRRLSGRGSHPLPADRQKVSGLYPAAALGRFSRVHPASLCRSWKTPPRSVLPLSKARSRLPPSSMRSSPSLWPRKALSGPENSTRQNNRKRWQCSTKPPRGMRMTQKERQKRSREEIYQAALNEFGTMDMTMSTWNGSAGITAFPKA